MDQLDRALREAARGLTPTEAQIAYQQAIEEINQTWQLTNRVSAPGRQIEIARDRIVAAIQKHKSAELTQLLRTQEVGATPGSPVDLVRVNEAIRAAWERYAHTLGAIWGWIAR